MRPRKFGPLEYSRSIGLNPHVTLMHHLELKAGRFRVNFGFQTQASVDNVKRMDAYSALKAKAVDKWSPHSVEWTLEDHWNAGGNFVTASALLQQILDGELSDPWPEDEGDAG